MRKKNKGKYFKYYSFTKNEDSHWKHVIDHANSQNLSQGSVSRTKGMTDKTVSRLFPHNPAFVK